MTSPDHRPSAGTEGAWATGIFAGSMLVMIGIFQAIEGLAAIINDDFLDQVDPTPAGRVQVEGVVVGYDDWGSSCSSSGSLSSQHGMGAHPSAWGSPS
jgi:hypothetical protein